MFWVEMAYWTCIKSYYGLYALQTMEEIRFSGEVIGPWEEEKAQLGKVVSEDEHS